MPWSTIKNLILLVIILVVMVALLFGVEGLINKAMGFYENLFGGKPEGKILYIKMDPDDNEIWNFYLTGEKEQLAEKQPMAGDLFFYNEWFLPSSLPESQCVIYTVDEEGGLLGDKGYYYYVNAGVRLQTYNEEGTEYVSLQDCLGNEMTKNCIGKTVTGLGCVYGQDAPMETCRKAAEEFAFVNCRCDEKPGKCDDKLLIEIEPFGEGVTPNGDCKDNKDKCSLLVEGNYEIKYGLICDDKGTWQPCTKNKADSTDPSIKVGDEKYMCCPDDDVFVWKEGEQC